MVRVRLHVGDPNSWHGQEQEGVWVKLVHALTDKAIVEICNIPFFCNYASMGDRIAVGLLQDELTLLSIVERGGHSTYRIYLEDRHSPRETNLKMLEALGCGWEQSEWGDGDLYAIDIPPESDFDEVYAVLKQGKLDGTWICDAGYFGHHEEAPPPA